MTDNIRVLMIEDNPSDADLVKRELKKNGLLFTSETVQTRETFEAALGDFLPDIILSDFNLPSFNGNAAFSIRQHMAPDVPFIIVSGTIGEERSIELIKNGVTDYALKENLFTLTPKIRRALKDAEELKEKRNTERELKLQYEKLLKIAFMQSHQVRVPIANILGLFNLFEFDNPSAPINRDVLLKLRSVAQSLDTAITEIVQNTIEIKSIIDKA